MHSVTGRILIIALSCLVMMVGVVFFTSRGLEREGLALEGEGNGSPGLDNLTPDAGPEIETPPLEEKSMNILFCGIDNTNALADVIMLAKFDIENHTVKVLQIPRDTFIGSGYTTGKINAACLGFGSKDPTARIASIIESQFRLRVDHYVAVTLDGVREIVDAIGGIEVDVPTQINYLPGKTLSPGVQVLDGEKSEWFIRYREGYKMGDIGRLEAQRAFISGALTTVKNMGKLRALSVAAKCYDKVSTDIPLSVAASLVKEGMKVEADQVEMHMVPCYGRSYGPYSVVVVSRFAFADLINDVFRPDEPISPWDLMLQYPPEQDQAEQASSTPAESSPFDFSWDESWGSGFAGEEDEGIIILNQAVEPID